MTVPLAAKFPGTMRAASRHSGDCPSASGSVRALRNGGSSNRRRRNGLRQCGNRLNRLTLESMSRPCRGRSLRRSARYRPRNASTAPGSDAMQSNAPGEPVTQNCRGLELAPAARQSRIGAGLHASSLPAGAGVVTTRLAQTFGAALRRKLGAASLAVVGQTVHSYLQLSPALRLPVLRRSGRLGALLRAGDALTGITRALGATL